ncbi:MAG: hypothetical protein RRB13_04215 [bacterium]|nr:hypothetical protein [bacterium]
MLQKLMIIGTLVWLGGCSVSSFGKFQAQEGMPDFIVIGQTTRAEVFDRLGEPLVHRQVAGLETVIYNHERGEFFILYGTYEGNELVLRFAEGRVVQAKIEKTGEGWGAFAPATSNNPGTRRSAR